jgi:hypothetical protein
LNEAIIQSRHEQPISLEWLQDISNDSEEQSGVFDDEQHASALSMGQYKHNTQS